MKKSKQNQLPKEQGAAFRKAAREAGCEDNEDRFQDALRKIAKGIPQARPSKKDD